MDSKKRSNHPRFIARAWKWIGKDSLSAASFKNIVRALVIATVAWFLIGFSMIGYWTWGIGSEEITRADAVRIVLTMTAGVGGIVALTIAYRKQRGTEEGRFMANLENAARQMGALEPTVQFAGIYALASLADESSNTRKQKCVDVLCGYLRLPYTATREASTLREVSERRTWFDTRGGVEETRTHQLRPAEKEVRWTIIRTITERLQGGAPNSWSNLNLDFRGAVLDGGEFSQAHFNGGTVDFTGADFNDGTVDFTGAKFNDGTVNFNADFNGGTVYFAGADFNGGTVDFTGANFNDGTVNFHRAKFNDGTVDFYGADFSGGTVNFSYAEFNDGTVNFKAATFNDGTVNFKADFNGGTVYFAGAAFNDGTVYFTGSDFNGGTVDFTGADFNGGTVIFNAKFNDGTVIFNAEFNDGIVDFDFAAFNGGTVYFNYADFNGGTVNFNYADFNDGTVDFNYAKFNDGTVNFSQPCSWKRPPIVPWGEGKTPGKVKPSMWPPKIFAEDEDLFKA